MMSDGTMNTFCDKVSISLYTATDIRNCKYNDTCVDNMMFSIVKRKVQKSTSFYQVESKWYHWACNLCFPQHSPQLWPVLHHCLAAEAHSNPTKLYLETFFDARTCLINSFLITVAQAGQILNCCWCKYHNLGLTAKYLSANQKFWFRWSVEIFVGIVLHLSLIF